ncbi:MAG: hypothetical protein B0D96_06210 [Candidatus Sedimenticola endophacoides]|uniref:Haloacid dehalogenase n=1 Tax=Candidatus Sedimenticola endophacoides TaxID=2548426 RepID=A0A6N4DYB9_9GAMM|nr:MAG: hypothetical protein B0D94_05585 [Candidatus Sedimenticola endophacoides]OQX35684.1 MAG: hypothetical protein B0D96_06210 [Candidatus Sedimenticola endophacoides]OQX41990.1 MAG: hypothetical protein B0D89_02410 [Candidatus Sedimenticola endophacoides]OQX47688.1 MAG: hypothetical protein B0D87_08935 [Candidatus Sedimenticola endophacoides]PUD97923.1 MAG: hypothetical protein C3L26_14285 [Candidatus Sedimenticola endophacoides]
MPRKQTRPRAILFDLFATLISVSKAAGGGRYTADILGLDRHAWNRACFSEHHEICRPTRQRDIVRRLAHSLDPEIPETLIAEACEERQRRFDRALIEVEAEILTVLGELRGRGIHLGLISNASTDEVRAWDRSPLAPLLDCALFSCHCGLKKPDPGIYHLGLRTLGLPPHQALFVGDGGSDEHLGARRAGIHSLQVTYFLERLSPEELAHKARGARGRINHIRELL